MHGPPEVLHDHIRLYWRVRAKLVPMLDNRTFVPLKLRDQVLETLCTQLTKGCLALG